MRRRFPAELLIWLIALISLACTDPQAHHFTLCPLANLGLTWCPGCGLGRAISYIFHADISGSFRQHWFGIPALFILLHRIGRLSHKFIAELQLIKP